jgi:hypothetical protein
MSRFLKSQLKLYHQWAIGKGLGIYLAKARIDLLREPATGFERGLNPIFLNGSKRLFDALLVSENHPLFLRFGTPVLADLALVCSPGLKSKTLDKTLNQQGKFPGGVINKSLVLKRNVSSRGEENAGEPRPIRAMLKALMDVRQRSKPPKRDFEASWLQWMAEVQ